MTSPIDAWPELDAPSLAPTAQTLHLWSQVVGKVRLARTPWINHSWQVTLRVSARGLATPLIPGEGVSFALEVDFVDQALVIRATDGQARQIALRPSSVADFYAAVMDQLSSLGVATHIDPTPNEVTKAIPFPEDVAPRPYDPDQAKVLMKEAGYDGEPIRFLVTTQYDYMFKIGRVAQAQCNRPVITAWRRLRPRAIIPLRQHPADPALPGPGRGSTAAIHGPV